MKGRYVSRVQYLVKTLLTKVCFPIKYTYIIIKLLYYFIQDLILLAFQGVSQIKPPPMEYDLQILISADADRGPRSRVRTAGHFAQPPINVSGNFSAHVSAE